MAKVIFGSNVAQKKRKIDNTKPWECICGETNKRYLVQCDMCGLEREFVASIKES